MARRTTTQLSQWKRSLEPNRKQIGERIYVEKAGLITARYPNGEPKEVTIVDAVDVKVFAYNNVVTVYVPDINWRDRT